MVLIGMVLFLSLGVPAFLMSHDEPMLLTFVLAWLAVSIGVLCVSFLLVFRYLRWQPTNLRRSRPWTLYVLIALLTLTSAMIQLYDLDVRKNWFLHSTTAIILFNATLVGIAVGAVEISRWRRGRL